MGPDDLSQGTGSVPPRQFIVGDGPCHGDFGGPAVSEETGVVAGVYSLNLSDAECEATGQRHVFTKVAPYAALVASAFASVGSVPRIEPSSEPRVTRSPS